MKKHFLEGLTLVVLAAICALISNAVAGRERKMALAGYYPGAMKVPKQSTAEPPPIATPAPVATTTVTTTVAAPQPVATTATTATVAPSPEKKAAPAPAVAKTTTTTTAAPPPAPATDVLAKFKEHPDKQYIEIGYNDVKALHDRGVLFLDARRTSVYEQGHIAGARPFSMWESDIDDKVKKLWEERQDPTQQALPIVVYCSGGECEDSHMLAQKLWGAQFNNVYVYKDGYPDWTAKRGAVKTGPNP